MSLKTALGWTLKSLALALIFLIVFVAGAMLFPMPTPPLPAGQMPAVYMGMVIVALVNVIVLALVIG